MVRLGPSSSCLAIILAIFAIGFVADSTAAQSQYVYKTIDPAGSAGTEAHGINDAGTIVGLYNVGSVFHAFQDANGTFSIVDFPQACSFSCGSEANAINNLGEIVGDFTDENGNTHGYYEIAGAFHSFDFPGAGLTIASGVNNKGTITGLYQNNSGGHGFELSNGQFTTFDCPGVSGDTETHIFGINDAGDFVGYCSAGSFKFTTTQGFTAVNFPGAAFTHATGINDLGEIVGAYADASLTLHDFLLSEGNALTIDPLTASPGGVSFKDNINDQGEIVGAYSDSQGVEHGFLAIGPELLDPVPDLIGGPAVVNDTLLQSLGLGGRTVKGIAADGVTEVVVRIPAQNVGDQFKLTLINDQNVQSNPANPNWDGALGSPGDTTFSLNQITVSAIGVNTQGGGTAPLAFAVYRAPVDFARQNPDGSYESGFCQFLNAASGFGIPSNTPGNLVGFQPQGDDQAACRTVSISVENLQTGKGSSLPVIIQRPPVVMIHGLWDNWQTWNDFSPLVSGTGTVDKRFYVGRVSYDFLIGPSISASVPDYSSSLVQLFFLAKKARANSLGFAFNAGIVQTFTDGWIENFKEGNNPMGIPAAAVQADIVAHSMGGDIARTIALQPNFLNDDNYGQGSIHKLITIDTPHLGSRLASALLEPQESCVQHWVLAPFGNFVFSSVTLGSPLPISGAVGDLSPSSQALANIGAQGSHPIPTALIAATYTNFGSAQSSPRANTIFLLCGNNDPLAQDIGLNPAVGWPAIFGEQSDAIVPLSSQLDGFSSSGFVFSGFLHSSGAQRLGFSGNTVLDPDSTTGIPSTVIKLLNTPITNTASFLPVNP